MKKTTEELAELRANEDWQALWNIAIPIAKYATVDTLGRPYVTEDLLQDAQVAAGKAVRTWDPAKGGFRHHIYVQVAGYVQDKANALPGGITGKRRSSRARSLDEISLQEPTLLNEGTDEEEAAELGDLLTYNSVDGVPEGFNEVEEEIRSASVNRAVELLLPTLDEELGKKDGVMVRSLYGIGRKAQTWREYSVKAHRSSKTVAAQHARALDLGKQKLTSVYRESTSLSSPVGRGSHRTKLWAPRGFWTEGFDTTPDDTVFFQQSTGRVWNDWSWSPEKEDKVDAALEQIGEWRTKGRPAATPEADKRSSVIDYAEPIQHYRAATRYAGGLGGAPLMRELTDTQYECDACAKTAGRRASERKKLVEELWTEFSIHIAPIQKSKRKSHVPFKDAAIEANTQSDASGLLDRGIGDARFHTSRRSRGLLGKAKSDTPRQVGLAGADGVPGGRVSEDRQSAGTRVEET